MNHISIFHAIVLVVLVSQASAQATNDGTPGVDKPGVSKSNGAIRVMGTLVSTGAKTLVVDIGNGQRYSIPIAATTRMHLTGFGPPELITKGATVRVSGDVVKGNKIRDAQVSLFLHASALPANQGGSANRESISFYGRVVSENPFIVVPGPADGSHGDQPANGRRQHDSGSKLRS